MSNEPLSDLARELLIAASIGPKGAKLTGREQKAAAREVAQRGFGQLNKSVSRLTATPAGRFVVETWETA